MGPVPCNDVIVAGCDKKAACRCVCAVDEDAVVDALRVWLVRDIDEPEISESSVHRPSAYPATLGDLSERGRTGGVGVDIVEVTGSCLVEAFVRG